ncbi:MAG: carboxypeptidase-like regulatory domain-containing protein, partial [Tannerella sp.]|nr:carboxypeptidase-like regulatory domain-containing protein [Tannerella sp.]
MAKLYLLIGSHKRFLSFLFFFICFLVGVNAVIAQNQIILQGKVIDERNNETIPGATILLKNDKTDLGVVTDIDGLFTLSIPFLPATIIVSYIGYRPQ